ncbi:MAG: tRNA pseudouridine(38-40) synthase TruA [Campylobacterales bacterium]|nr:tRNA pseudouridine(38-40) synthase TruA [Campylobacterales bacterium]
MRIKATLEYDGSLFKGFQSQKNTKNTVAGHLQNALLSLEIKDKIIASGRTDAGVHASNQVIHFDIPEFWNDTEKLQQEINKKLTGICIKKIENVNDDFHARYSAKKRQYRYIFQTKKPDVFHERYVSFYENVDKKLLQEALSCFLGEHDFKNYSKNGSEPKSTVRNIYKTIVYRYKEYHIITLEANGFLRSQVRMICADAIRYAQKKIELKTIKEKLITLDSFHTKPASANGLYLSRVFY